MIQNNSQEKYYIWRIDGGLGKNVAATALVDTVKKTYPDRKLIIVASHPQIFLNHPNVDRVYSGHTPYFYENYVENKDIIVCNQEPYNQTGHITRQKHLLENWCDLLGIKYENQTPKLYFNYAQKKAYAQGSSPKPILLLHTGGGPTNDTVAYNWTRDIPIEFAQEIVKKYQNEYNIVQVTRPNGYKLDGVTVVDKNVTNLNLFSLLKSSSKRILIDSCLQHAATALKLPSTVLWIGTKPELFGYKEHKNIIADLPQKANQLVDSFLFDYHFQQNEYQCPYREVDEIFSLETLNKL